MRGEILFTIICLWPQKLNKHLLSEQMNEWCLKVSLVDPLFTPLSCLPLITSLEARSRGSWKPGPSLVWSVSLNSRNCRFLGNKRKESQENTASNILQSKFWIVDSTLCFLFVALALGIGTLCLWSPQCDYLFQSWGCLSFRGESVLQDCIEGAVPRFLAGKGSVWVMELCEGEQWGWKYIQKHLIVFKETGYWLT